MGVKVRPVVRQDEMRWRELFEGYCVFYKRTPSEPLTRHTWARILDSEVPIHAIVAEHDTDGVIGPKTRVAIRQFQREIGEVPDGFATLALLTRLRALTSS